MKLPYLTGVLTVYQNNGVFDYERLAKFTAKRAADLYQQASEQAIQHCSIPTNSQSSAVRSFFGVEAPQKFLNDQQVEAMAATPYEVTIFMDADFVPVSSGLLLCASMVGPERPLMFLTTRNVMHSNLVDNLQADSQNPFDVWSTLLVYFNDRRPESLTSRFFNEVRRVRDNWSFWAQQIGVTDQFYRNDFAFAIAFQRLHLPLQYRSELLLPSWYKTIFYFDAPCTRLTESSVIVDGLLSPYDAHVMHKPSLIRSLDSYGQSTSS